MSGIFGIFRRDGAPVEKDTLTHMQRAMSFWGPDGAATWHSGPAGLGHLLRHNTPEARFEAMPMHDPVSGRTMTAAARLDNYDELCDQFEIPAVERPTTPDGRLVRLAYTRWGEECVNHLFGDWSFAVWDERARHLFLARDHHGNTSLYTYQSESLFAFASSLKSLMALSEVPLRLNQLRFAQVLSAWVDGDGIQTVYADIQRLPPAHTRSVTTTQDTLHRYWYLENTPLLHLPREDDYVDGLYEHLQRAVKVRLRSDQPVGTTLSGGLDSGSVSTMAASLLRADGKDLHAFGSVPQFDVSNAVAANRFGDESALMQKTAASAPNIQLHLLRSEGISPIQALYDGLATYSQPIHAAANLYWLHDLSNQARLMGLGTLLTGQMGNGTISWTGKASAQSVQVLLRNRNWRQLVKSLLIKSMPDVYKRYRQHQIGSAPWLKYTALNPDFINKIDLTSQMKAAGHDPYFLSELLSPLEHRARLIKPGLSSTGAFWCELGAAHYLDFRDPTADTKLMMYCFSVPDCQYAGSSGSERLLVRRAMNGMMPDAVLWNRHKGVQSADILHRVLAFRGQAEEALAKLEMSPQAGALLDLNRLRSIVSEMVTSKKAELSDEVKTVLLRGLMGGLFLSTLSPSKL